MCVHLYISTSNECLITACALSDNERGGSVSGPDKHCSQLCFLSCGFVGSWIQTVWDRNHRGSVEEPLCPRRLAYRPPHPGGGQGGDRGAQEPGWLRGQTAITLEVVLLQRGKTHALSCQGKHLLPPLAPRGKRVMGASESQWSPKDH